MLYLLNNPPSTLVYEFFGGSPQGDKGHAFEKEVNRRDVLERADKWIIICEVLLSKAERFLNL